MKDKKHLHIARSTAKKIENIEEKAHVLCFERNIVFADIKVAARCCYVDESVMLQALKTGKVLFGYTWAWTRPVKNRKPQVTRFMPFPRGPKEDQIKYERPIERNIAIVERQIKNSEARLARRMAERMIRLNTIRTMMATTGNVNLMASKLNRTVEALNTDIKTIQASDFADSVNASDWKLLLISQARDIHSLAMDEFIKSRKKTITKGDQVTLYEQAGDSAFLNVALSAVNFQAKVLNIADMEEQSDGGYKKFLEDLAKKVTVKELKEAANPPRPTPTIEAEYDALLNAPTGSILEAHSTPVIDVSLLEE